MLPAENQSMSLFNELKKRNVFRVGIAYVVSAWVIAQVVELVLDSIEAPAWVMQALLLGLGLGFIAALIIAWAYELTPEGIKKEKDVLRDDSITSITAKKLDYITLAGVLLVVALFTYQQLKPADDNQPTDVVLQDSATLINKENTQQQKPIASEPQVIAEVSNKSIAVLPFSNMANNPENEPFTVGLHDDLLTHLSKISALKVISRTSVMEYKDTTKNIKDIAKELGVANVLEGGVQRSGNQIRLNVQLIDADTDEHLWAEIYDRELTTTNIFNIQTEVSKEIAKALKAQLTPAENKSIETAPTDNLEAYDAYLAARQLIEKRKSEPLKQALVLFKKASELDPNYALAYAGQALTLHLLGNYSDLRKENVSEQIESLIDKAIEINPLLAEAHAIKGTHFADQGKIKEAEASFKLSIGLNPNLAETYHFYGHMLRNIRPAESLTLHRKAVELDPLSNIILANLGWVLMAINNQEEALDTFKKLHKLNPEFTAGLQGIAWVNDVLGNYAQAIIHQAKGINLDPNNVGIVSWLLSHYFDIGDATAAQNELGKVKKIVPYHPSYRYPEAVLKMLSGEYQAAQQGLLKALEDDPENKSIKRNIAQFSILNGDCELSVQMWRSVAPEMFLEDYLLYGNNMLTEIELVWCLNQMGQKQTADQLLEKILLYSNKIGKANQSSQFYQAAILAVQNKSKEAAEAYAKVIASKRTRDWYWIDHLPYYAEMRKEPVFIKARKQLMQDLAEQRAFLAAYRAKENSL